MVSVRCATYVSGEAVVNLTYGETDRSLRAVVDAFDKTALPKLGGEEYTPICKSYIAQLATKKMNWMCYAVKLDNGEFLIIDSGGNNAGNYLYESLMKMSGGEGVTVAAWIITHFHQDHVGGLVSLMSNDEYAKKIRIKKLIHNFPQKQLLDTAYGAGDRRNISMWDETLRKTGAEVCRARTGQRFTFGNAEVEMLFTYEDLMPFNVFAERTNPTSHIFSVSIAGQKIMILGDACREATELCAERYGDTLRSEFVQLSHHGWGDINTSREFYRLVGAPYVLYPSATYSPKPSEAYALSLAKEYFLNPEEDAIIDLPYKQ
jgi:beta-lactamase superfamily II metal-dependent hydrolase